MVREKPALHWSLEPIAGRLRLDGVIAVSTTWIYLVYLERQSSWGIVVQAASPQRKAL